MYDNYDAFVAYERKMESRRIRQELEDGWDEMYEDEEVDEDDI